MGELLGYLPDRYRGSPEAAEFQRAMQPWADRLHADREDLFAQLFTKSATWGLRAWEAALGIETDIAKPYGYRRTRIESKLRGLGVTTKAMIKNVASSFSNGEVEIIEYPREYRFEVIFTGTVGIPPNMADLTAAIEEVKPAHLAYAYVYLYRTWDMAAHMAWDGAAAYTWDQLLGGEL